MWRQGAFALGLVPVIWLAAILPLVSGDVLVQEVGASVKQAFEIESGADASMAQSLTRDFLFFLTFVGQVVLFLIFFWEKPTSTKRWNVGEEAAEDAKTSRPSQNEPEASSSGVHDLPTPEVKNVQGNESHQAIIAPPEGSRATNDDGRASTQLDEDFEPLESTIRDLQHRITGLESTLNRRKGHYPTESLKSRLRECISTITGTLSTLEAQSPSSDSNSPAELEPLNRIDITKWPLESIQSSKRQLEIQLEQLEAAPVMQLDNPSQFPSSTPLLRDKSLEFTSSTAPKSDVIENTSTVPLTTATDAPKPDMETKPTDTHADTHEHTEVSDPSGAGELGDPELEMLAQQLIAPKKGRKGGVVKISAKDVSALSFFAEGADELHTAHVEPSLGPSDISSPATQHKPSETALPLEEATHIDQPATTTTATEHPISTPPTTSTSDFLPISSDFLPISSTDDVQPKTDDDDLADLAKLMAAPGKKKAGKKKNDLPAVPANIFNMFDTLSSYKTESPDASRHSSPRSNTSDDNGEQDQSTKDLLAQLEGMPSLPSDLTLPSDFSLPSDDLNVSGGDDLLAALNAVSDAQKKNKDSDASSDDDDSDNDDNGSTTSESDVSSTSGASEVDENEELDEIAKERPAVTAFSASEALNKSGLQRAKKTVPMGKGGKKGSYQMEDYHFCSFPWENPNWGLFCVFDGHSGKDCAENAARILPQKLKANLAGVDLSKRVDLTDVLTKTFLDTDAELLEFEYEGSTATVVFVYKTESGHRYLQAANVGDSSAIIVRKGKSVALTQDHHPNYPVEMERLQALGIEINPGQTRLNGLAVSRALGDQFPKSTECGIVASPSVSPLIHLKDSDSHVILASDGLWDVISFQTSFDIINGLDSVTEMSDALLKTATRSSKCTDNVTTIVVML